MATMNNKKKIAVSAIGLGIVAYLIYKSMKKSIPSSGYVFPNGYADTQNWQNADDGTDSPENKKTKMMVGIARAEGFGVPGSIPSRANNPGDLTRSLGYDTTGETLGSAGIVIFVDVPNGWAALEEQLTLIQNGGSIHKLTDTLLQFAQGYTTTDQEAWANNVSQAIGLDPSATLSDALS